MFKYIAYKRVDTGTTVLEFRGKDDAAKVHHFDGDVVAVEYTEEVVFSALMSAQPAEILATEITLDEFKTAVANSAQVLRIREIAAGEFAARLKLVTKQYPIEERETWGIQIQQAEAYIASSNVADAPFLSAIAGEYTVADIATSVLAKKVEYEEIVAQELAAKRAREKEMLAKVGYM